MILSLGKFILLIILITLLLMRIFSLLAHLIKRRSGKRKYRRFTNAVDKAAEFIASLTGSV